MYSFSFLILFWSDAVSDFSGQWGTWAKKMMRTTAVVDRIFEKACKRNEKLNRRTVWKEKRYSTNCCMIYNVCTQRLVHYYCFSRILPTTDKIWIVGIQTGGVLYFPRSCVIICKCRFRPTNDDRKISIFVKYWSINK